MVAVITVAGVQVVTVDLPEIAVAGVISQDVYKRQDYGYKFSATGNWSPDNKNKY